MRILAMSYLFPNSVQQNYGIFVYNRLKAVAQIHDITIIAPIPWFPLRHFIRGYPDLRSVPFSEKKDGLTIYHPRFFVIPKYIKCLDPFMYFLCTLPLILYLLRTRKFDLIDVHWVYPDIFAGLVVSKVINKPLIVTIRGKDAVCDGEISIRKRMLDYWLKKATRVICLSRELAEITKSIGVSIDKINVLPNGVDIKLFKLIDQGQCRNYLDVPLDKKMILSIGYLTEQKGFHHIINCLSTLIRSDNDVVLYIIGSSPSPECEYIHYLNELVDLYQLSDRIIFKGTISNSELPYWYNAADVFCLATSTEGSPNVVMEALACGCPAVVSSVGGIPDIMSEGFLGNVFNLTDKNGLAEALENYFSREWDRQRIRKHMERYSWTWCAENVDNVYRGVSK